MSTYTDYPKVYGYLIFLKTSNKVLYQRQKTT